MASNHTENLGLNQWTAEDIVRREDFNADNAKIDAALADAAQIVFGTYKGDGTASRFVDLGFTPRAVFVTDWMGSFYTSGGGHQYLQGGLALRGYSGQACSITEGGITVAYGDVNSNFHTRSNQAGQTYRYLAIK